MYPTLLHIYGPFEINSYGLAIALSVGLFLYLTLKHPIRKQYISEQEYINSVVTAGFIGVLGGRILHIVSEWNSYSSAVQMVSIWQGGLSVLGTVMAILIYAFFKLRASGIPLLPVLDLVTLYAPLMHAISRIGCFLTGCCYGCPTELAWGITYTNPDVVAPLYCKIHPTQLYSSLLFFMIFAVLYCVAKRKNNRPGLIALLYISLQSIERFAVDFLRGDRIMTGTRNLGLSIHQWLALMLFIVALGCALYICYRAKYLHQSNESI